MKPREILEMYAEFISYCQTGDINHAGGLTQEETLTQLKEEMLKAVPERDDKFYDNIKINSESRGFNICIELITKNIEALFEEGR
jgi:phosphoserine aminotransferase